MKIFSVVVLSLVLFVGGVSADCPLFIDYTEVGQEMALSIHICQNRDGSKTVAYMSLYPAIEDIGQLENPNYSSYSMFFANNKPQTVYITENGWNEETERGKYYVKYASVDEQFIWQEMWPVEEKILNEGIEEPQAQQLRDGARMTALKNVANVFIDKPQGVQLAFAEMVNRIVAKVNEFIKTENSPPDIRGVVEDIKRNCQGTLAVDKKFKLITAWGNIKK